MLANALVDALGAVRDEDWARALELLLVAWQRGPALELLPAVAAVDARARETAHGVIALRSAYNPAWIACAKTGDAATRGILCKSAAQSSSGETLRRFEALHARGPDPRFAEVVCDFIGHGRVPREAQAKLNVRIWTLLTELGDPRVADRARGWLAAWKDQPIDEVRDARLRAVLPALDAIAPAVLTDAERDACREIVALAPVLTSQRERREREREALLSAVYAAPDDEAPREAYADWLQHHGDPRGEFIALQLASARVHQLKQRPQERMLALEQTYDYAWRHPLPARAQRIHYLRGFPISADTTGPIDDDPAWATIICADGVPASDRATVPSLVDFQRLTSEAIEQLATLHKPLPVLTLEWVGLAATANGFSPTTIDPFCRITCLPRLRSFYFRDAAFGAFRPHGDELRWLLRAPCTRRVEHAQLTLPSGCVGSLVPHADASAVTRLTIFAPDHADVTFELERDDAGRLGMLTLTLGPNISDAELAEAIGSVAMFERDQLSWLKYRILFQSERRAETYRALRDAVARQTRLALFRDFFNHPPPV